jgi:hypothetical protein
VLRPVFLFHGLRLADVGLDEFVEPEVALVDVAEVFLLVARIVLFDRVVDAAELRVVVVVVVAGREVVG